MTLKEELEILRGEPIESFDGDPMDIPCIETSDAEKLCKNPVVSVHMITYNHEPYIRQAIEGVMMQKTDFEFELVIGEDASTDKTREICFEYQKRYPDKIRVLWWHENLGKVGHPAGGNGKRTTAHCRGEFIAFCEGDDYWIDTLKLQKQVDIMKKHPNVGLCFGGARMMWFGRDKVESWNRGAGFVWPSGVINGHHFFLTHVFGVSLSKGHYLASSMLMTASVMLRRTVMDVAFDRYKEVFSYKFRLGDSTLWLAVSSIADAFFLPDEVSVYRQISSGICQRLGYNVHLDGILVRLYYVRILLGLRLSDVCVVGFDEFVKDIGKKMSETRLLGRWRTIWGLMATFPCFVLHPRYIILFTIYFGIGYGRYVEKISNRILSMTRHYPVSKRLKQVVHTFDKEYS